MAEKRRLFINPDRLKSEIDLNGVLKLTSEEAHYIHRVMRMRSKDPLEVIDGKGHLWDAQVVKKEEIRLTSNIYAPLKTVKRENPIISIAVAIPKKGFEDFLQMSCEIGVDVIQPLIAKRSVVEECSHEKNIRYQKIIHEAVEQSERLWSPELMESLTFSDWINDLPPDAQIGFTTTRTDDLTECVNWLNEIPTKVNQVWLVIGPEGGWEKDEEKLAFNTGLVGLSIGENILRTSTAAVSACHLMTTWRRLKSNSSGLR